MNKYFVFGDSHGHYEALISSLEAAGFDIDNPNHMIIGCGDYFDRGDRNAQIYNFLTSEKLIGRVYLVYGNHDAMLKDFLSKQNDGVFNATYNGLNKTIGNFAQVSCNSNMLMYDGDFYISKIKQNYPNLMKFLQSMEDSFTLDEYIFTHAGLKYENMYDTWAKPIWVVDHWANTPTFVNEFKSVGNYLTEGKKFVFGHWHARRLRSDFGLEPSNETFKYKNFIGLDACTNASGFVNVLVIESDNLPQVNKNLEY